jgi:cytoskeletal protein RodZ
MRKNLPQLEQERAEKLAEIGGYLRQSREGRSLSLEEVSAKTMIPVRTLRAIEGGDLKQLPEPVYVHGFIRRFADSLGLKGVDVAGEFPTTMAMTRSRRRFPWLGLRLTQPRPMHLYLLYVAVIVVAVNGLSRLIEESAPATVNTANLYEEPLPVEKSGPVPDQVQQPRPAQAINRPAETNKVTPRPDSKPVASQPDRAQRSVEVSLTFKEQSWVRIVTDGRMAFEGMMQEGAQRSWSADERVVVRAGNAGGVLVALNGGEAKALGAPGDVEEVTFELNNPSAALPPTVLGSVTTTASVIRD